MEEFSTWSDKDVLDFIGVMASSTRPIEREAKDVQHAYTEVDERGLRVDSHLLARWVELVGQKIWWPESYLSPKQEVMTAALADGSPEVVESLRTALSAQDMETRWMAAEVLGRLHDTASVPHILDMLDDLAVRDEMDEARLNGFPRIVRSLVLMGDPSVASRLQQLIKTAPDEQVSILTAAIRRLTKHSLPPNKAEDRFGWLDSVDDQCRDAWAHIDLTADPVPRVQWEYGSRPEAVVTDGRDIFALEADDDLFATMPEWGFSWYHDGDQIYTTGTVCTTCDIVLTHIGWPGEEVVRMAQVVRDHVSDVTALDGPLLEALEPLMTALASGRYQLRLVDLPLKQTTWADSRTRPLAICSLSPLFSTMEGGELKGTDIPVLHRVRDGESIPFVIAPTQPPQALSSGTVAEFVRTISEGRHPAMIVAAHSAEREPWNSDRVERSVTGFILDGHHKAAAYLEMGLPIRTILICDRTPRQPAYVPDPLEIFDELIGDL